MDLEVGVEEEEAAYDGVEDHEERELDHDRHLARRVRVRPLELVRQKRHQDEDDEVARGEQEDGARVEEEEERRVGHLVGHPRRDV